MESKDDWFFDTFKFAFAIGAGLALGTGLVVGVYKGLKRNLQPDVLKAEKTGSKPCCKDCGECDHDDDCCQK